MGEEALGKELFWKEAGKEALGKELFGNEALGDV